jgi:hypothetical protein
LHGQGIPDRPYPQAFGVGAKKMEDETMQNLTINKLRAEIRKLKAETDKLMAETRWYPLVVSTALIASVVAVTKLFL